MPSVKQPLPFTPYWQTTDEATVRLYQGHVIHALRWMPGKSVQEVVTSPPYWGLRSYDTGDVKHLEIGSEASPDCLGWARDENCAERDWATGCHVCRMVLVFREVRRVLRDDGTLWLNYGDSYSASGGHAGQGGTSQRKGRRMIPEENNFTAVKTGGLPSGNLCGVPWRVALALQADGWVLRQDVIWQKPSPMPESVVNRCTKAHEYVFLLTKGSKYYYDAEAIKDSPTEGIVRRVESERNKLRPRHDYKQENAVGLKATDTSNPSPNAAWHDPNKLDRLLSESNKRSVWSVDDERALLDWLAINDPGLLEKYLTDSGYKSDVWRVASAGYPGAHYATFPPKLITPCILAGTSEYGCCGECGAPWKRVTEETKLRRERPNEYVKRTGEEGTGNSCANTVAGVETKTVGWEPTCTCNGEFVKRKVRVEKSGNRYTGGDRNEEGDCGETPRSQGETETTLTEYIPSIPLEDHPVIPCTVLDPFIGSGTTAIVALDHGRHCWGIDLSKQYLDENAIPRIRAWFNARPDLRSLIGTLTRPAPKQGKSVVRNGVGR